MSTWGDSRSIEVGDWILAAGNPFGVGGSVTAGIISARGRDIGAGPFDDFLQIDAPINPGNSGGPTFNMTGEVVGVNTAIVSPTGGSVGIGFAIPAELARASSTTCARMAGSTAAGSACAVQDDAGRRGRRSGSAEVLAGLDRTGPAAQRRPARRATWSRPSMAGRVDTA